MKKYKMASFLFVSTLAYLGNLSTIDNPHGLSNSLIITTIAFLVATGFGAWQIHESEKERAVAENKLNNAKTEIHSLRERLNITDNDSFLMSLLDKANNDWLIQCKEFNTHLNKSESKRVYYEILKGWNISDEEIKRLNDLGILKVNLYESDRAKK